MPQHIQACERKKDRRRNVIIFAFSDDSWKVAKVSLPEITILKVDKTVTQFLRSAGTVRLRSVEVMRFLCRYGRLSGQTTESEAALPPCANPY